MKKLILIFAILSLVVKATSEKQYHYRVGQSSYITISGITNVNKFECLWTESISQGSLTANIDPLDGEIKFEDAVLFIDIQGFNCENRIMTNDMHRAMGVGDHPLIEIKLLKAEVQQNKQSSANSGDLNVLVAITINGVQKETFINVNWKSAESIYYIFNGTKSLKMTDFDIEPPTRLMGMVKVNDMIKIEINLALQTLLISQS